MNQTIFVLGSITYAVKARRLLRGAGIQARLIKRQADTSLGGCRYGLEVAPIQKMLVEELLQRERIPYTMGESVP